MKQTEGAVGSGGPRRMAAPCFQTGPATGCMRGLPWRRARAWFTDESRKLGQLLWRCQA